MSFPAPVATQCGSGVNAAFRALAAVLARSNCGCWGVREVQDNRRGDGTMAGEVDDAFGPFLRCLGQGWPRSANAGA